MDERQVHKFREKVWEYYREHGRDHLPWRQEVTPYGVFVSEIMLQQTQVSRVLERYGRWLRRFAGFEALAEAARSEVLAEWQGMGYNRRALWLKAASEMIRDEYGGKLPEDAAELIKLPGVGPHTAGSMAAFAYDAPTVFIETNIRRAFIHEFFVDREGVSDAELRPLVEAAVKTVVREGESPREWYWALMDYGSDLAKRVPNPNRRSKHYVVQSKFEGSVRQLRGEVLRKLVAEPRTLAELEIEDARLVMVLETLVKERFVTRDNERYRIS